MNKLTIISFLTFFIIVCMVGNARAAATFDLMQVPNYVDDQLGCGTFIGGLLVSLVVFCLIMLPTIYLTKGKAYSFYIVFGMVILAPLTAIGWFSVWVYIGIVLLLALGFGGKIADFLGGIGK
jgi:hypothetical protein